MLRKDIKRNARVNADSVDEAEIAKFNALAKEWWNPKGKFKTVHAFNALRIKLIGQQLAAMLGRDFSADQPLKGVKLLDVGCGAGLVAEAMASYGAEVFGIDASEQNILIAKSHAEQSGLNIHYRHGVPEDFAAAEAGRYDVVLSLEVVEHVPDLELFMQATSAFVKQGGALVVGTINRTPKSYAVAIVGAEYILKMLPIGTHEWSKFVKPSELDELLGDKFLSHDITGVAFNPLTKNWFETKDKSVNYLRFWQKS